LCVPASEEPAAEVKEADEAEEAPLDADLTKKKKKKKKPAEEAEQPVRVV
jgi:hypothetical protein